MGGPDVTQTHSVAQPAPVIVLLLTADAGTLADVAVLFLITVCGMVCLAALVLRRRPVDHEHYRAATWLLVLGLVGNVALLPYTAIDGTINREPGEPALLYCGVMLAVGVGLYFVDNLFTKGDPEPMTEKTLES
jgi:hypothetical protein